MSGGVKAALSSSRGAATWSTSSDSTFLSSCTVTGDLDYNPYVDKYAILEQCVVPAAVVQQQQQHPPPFRVFCDLDGVLVDFAQGVTRVLGLEDDATPLSSQNIDALPRGELWETVSRAPSFFEHLPWCPGGRALWRAIAPLQPNILTGVPSYCLTAPRDEKFQWCFREFSGATTTHNHRHHDHHQPVPAQFQHVDKAARWGPLRVHATVRQKSVHNTIAETLAPSSSSSRDDSPHHHEENDWTCKVITCWSEQKFRESGPGVVLIDDRIDLKPAWEAQGGIFIHHETGNVDATLRQLREHGILPSVDDPDPKSDSSNDSWRRSSFRP